MESFGEVTEPQTVRLERILPGPVERVWAYLTDSEKRGKWLAPGEMELRVGGRVSLTFNNQNLSIGQGDAGAIQVRGRPHDRRTGHALRAPSPARLHLGQSRRSDLRADAERQGRALRGHASPRPRPQHHGHGLERLAHAYRRADRRPQQRGAAAVLEELPQREAGIRKTYCALSPGATRRLRSTENRQARFGVTDAPTRRSE